MQLPIGQAVLYFLLSTANANEAGECGNAKVISGDTCSNVKVEFSFDGCAHQSPPQMARKIICKGHSIKARYASEQSKYEAEFKKIDDNWGGVRWEKVGGVRQISKKAVPENAVSEKVTSVEETRAPSAAMASPPVEDVAMQSSIKFSAFMDFRYSAYDAGSNPAVNNDHSEAGFGLEDGAFYLNFDNARLSVIMDLAFRRSKAGDTNSSATAPNSSDNANLMIGWDKSQAYVRYKIADEFLANFGQFDTIYGVELNDSKDRVFGKTGLVYDLTLPVTHTGVMFEYLKDGFYGKVLAANPNNKGTNGTSTAGDESTEYGAALGYSAELYRFQLGYLTRPITKADGVSRGDRSLADLTLGTTIGPFSLDVEYSVVADPSKNTLTTSATDEEDAGSGLLALAQFKVTDALGLGARYEVIDKDPAAGSIDHATAFGGVVRYTVNQNLGIRVEYNGYNFERVNGDKFYDSRANVAALVQF